MPGTAGVGDGSAGTVRADERKPPAPPGRLVPVPRGRRRHARQQLRLLRVRALLAVRAEGDVAHDAEHIRRVVTNARQLAASTGADERVVVPAAWLHDCVSVAKDSPQRTQASRLAATAADFLRASGYPATYIPAIEHAIEAHSFSAGIAPRTLEARVVQDADRLDTLGAVGIARHPDTSA